MASTYSLHVEKHKKADLTRVGKHNERDEKVKHKNKKIDPSRTHLNKTLRRMEPKGTYTQMFNKCLAENHPEGRKYKPRKNANAMVGITVNFGGDITEWPPEEQEAVLEEMAEWLAERYPHVLGAHIHRDEHSVGLHFDLVPLTPDGRLNSKELFSPKTLHMLQAESLVFLQEIIPEAGFRRKTDEETLLDPNGRTMEQYKRLMEERDRLADELRGMKADVLQSYEKAEGEIKSKEAALTEERLANAKREEAVAKKEKELAEKERELAKAYTEDTNRKYEIVLAEKKLGKKEQALASREELTRKAEEDLRKAQAQFELEKVRLETERNKFKSGKADWIKKAEAYKADLEAVNKSQKVKGAELNKRERDLDNRAQTLSDLENRLKMDEKAISDGFENLESERAEFEAYMAERQEELRNEREELDNARELLETKTEDLKELKGSLFTKAKYMNDTARATEGRITGLISMGQVQEAQREAEEYEAWNHAEMEQIFDDLEEASDFAL